MPYAPVVTTFADMRPVPRAAIKFETVAAGCERATVYRITRNKYVPVSAAINVYAAGGFAVVDFEIPFSEDVSYVAQMFDVNGLDLGYTDAATTFLPFEGTVIQQPTNPYQSVQVDPLPEFAAQLRRRTLGDVVYPQGRNVGVFVGSGRTGYVGVNLDVATDTDQQGITLENVLGSFHRIESGVLCVRTQPKWRVSGPLFAVVQEPSQERLDVEFGGQVRYWRMTGDEVARPAPSLSESLLTYADLEAAFVAYDYAALEASYITYLDAESDYTIAGLDL